MEKEDFDKLKAAYEKARKKYRLPKFEELDKEFEICKIEESHFIIREVRRCMIEKLRAVAEYFGPALDPAPERFHSLIEMGAFDKHEHKQVTAFFKKCGYLIHDGVRIGVASIEKQEADYIKRVWKEWPAIRKEALKYMENIVKQWAKPEKTAKEDVGYVG